MVSILNPGTSPPIGDITDSPCAGDTAGDVLMETQGKSREQELKPSSFGMRRTYSRIDISADKWLMVCDPISLGKLENPPSLAEGLSREMEKSIRYLGSELIQLGAILLKLPQTAAATGQILYHRFYYQKSFVRYNFQHMVMACLLLASKIEEEPRRPRDVINVYHRLKQLLHWRSCARMDGSDLEKRDPKKFQPMLLDRVYSELKNEVIRAERRILNVLGFVVHVHHPHKLIHVYLHTLGQLDSSRELLQRAWSYMNDSLRTDIFLRYRPETIACACIYLAARTLDRPVVLPSQPFPWFELFDVSDRDVKAISSTILGLYTIKETPNLRRVIVHVEHLRHQLLEREKKTNGDKPNMQAKGEAELKDLIQKVKQQRSEVAAATLATINKPQPLPHRERRERDYDEGERGERRHGRYRYEKERDERREHPRRKDGEGDRRGDGKDRDRRRDSPPPRDRGRDYADDYDDYGEENGGTRRRRDRGEPKYDEDDHRHQRHGHRHRHKRRRRD